MLVIAKKIKTNVAPDKVKKSEKRFKQLRKLLSEKASSDKLGGQIKISIEKEEY